MRAPMRHACLLHAHVLTYEPSSDVLGAGALKTWRSFCGTNSPPCCSAPASAGALGAASAMLTNRASVSVQCAARNPVILPGSICQDPSWCGLIMHQCSSIVIRCFMETVREEQPFKTLDPSHSLPDCRCVESTVTHRTKGCLLVVRDQRDAQQLAKDSLLSCMQDAGWTHVQQAYRCHR